jgi:Ran GTPase-activating protein (RanGAP) involved in mRNA processing and transport
VAFDSGMGASHPLCGVKANRRAWNRVELGTIHSEPIAAYVKRPTIQIIYTPNSNRFCIRKGRMHSPNKTFPPLYTVGHDILDHISDFTVNKEDLGKASKKLWNIVSRRDRHKNMKYYVTEANVKRLLAVISEPMVSLETTSFEILKFTTGLRDDMPELYKRVHRLFVRATQPLEATQHHVADALNGVAGAHCLHTLKLDFDLHHRSQHGHIGNTGALALSALQNAPRLHTLTLSVAYNNIDGDGLQFLVALGRARALRMLRINLRGNRVAFSESAGSKSTLGAEALASMKNLPHLENLDLELRETFLENSDIAVLVALKHAPKLQVLRLGLVDNLFCDEACTHIASLYQAKNMRSLDLNIAYTRDHGANIHTRIGHMGIQQLVALKDTPALVVLVLGVTIPTNENGHGDEGVCARALAQLRHLPLLYSLILVVTGNPIGDLGAHHLAKFNEARALQNLHLSIKGHRIGDVGAKALGVIDRMHTLSLALSDNQISGEGARGLSNLKHGAFLHSLHLDLERNQIGDTGTWALVELKDLPAIQNLSLVLNYNNIGSIGAAAFGELRTVDSLCQLDVRLANNHIRCSGIADLVELRHAFNLNTLSIDLSYNQIGSTGAAAIATLNTCRELRTLSINAGGNYIGDTGALFLAALRYAPHLERLRLYLGNCNISTEGGDFLRTILSIQGPSKVNLGLQGVNWGVFL